MAGSDEEMKAKQNSIDSAESVDDEPISMLEVLQEESNLEDDAHAVLGGSDANNCTYDMGYVERQALYACLTCCERESAAICLACSYECHENHNLVELYTKRNVKCDCGNNKFQNFTCKLQPNKATLNEDNKYNQNYRGLYCTCSRPYPDPEDEVEDEMIQCVICEDWLHGRHLGGPAPPVFDEMICDSCMKKHEFLFAYAVSGAVTKIESEESSLPVNIDSPTKRRSSAGSDSKESPPHKKLKSEKGNEKATCSIPESIGIAESSFKCKLKDLIASETNRDRAVFWPEGWRKKLCDCPNCKMLYKEQNIEFLANESDTIRLYEERGKAKLNAQGSQYEQGMQALSSMNRIQQVEVLSGFNDLKDELKDYLKTFAESKKVVTEEDIKSFFVKMASKKKSNAMSYFCK